MELHGIARCSNIKIVFHHNDTNNERYIKHLNDLKNDHYIHTIFLRDENGIDTLIKGKKKEDIEKGDEE
jgi:ribosomal protein L7Ae-like RNA K-turn-binding protein